MKTAGGKAGQFLTIKTLLDDLKRLEVELDQKIKTAGGKTGNLRPSKNLKNGPECLIKPIDGKAR